MASDYLPDDLLENILVKLPSQYTVQCKAVCKRWFSLISNSYFVQQAIHCHHKLDDSLTVLIRYYHTERPDQSLYLQASTSNTLLNAHGSTTGICFLNFLPEPSYIAAYFNDLILCCSESLRDPVVYYICNPLTKQWLRLPPPPPPQNKEKTLLGFVCYPYSCRQETACTSTTNLSYKYKVVRIPTFHGNFHGSFTKLKLDMFCSESGTWSQFVVSSPRPLNRDCNNIIAYNGILHWLDEMGKIVAYDPLNNVESFRIIRVPIGLRRTGLGNNRLLDSGGNLLLSQLSIWRNSIVSSWKLKDYTKGIWGPEEKVSLDGNTIWNTVSEDSRACQAYLGVIGIHPYNADVLYLAVSGDRVVLCNMTSRTLHLVNGNMDLEFWTSSVIPLLHPWWPTPVPPLMPDHHLSS